MEKGIAQVKRPKLLTITCILSFTGIVILIALKIAGLLNVSFMQPENIFFQYDQSVFSENEFIKELLFEKISNAFCLLNHLKHIYWVSLLLSLVTLTGIIMLWKQKRLGFYLYLAGKLTAISTPLFFCGFAKLFIAMSVVGLIITVVFGLLYSINMKALR